MVNAELSAEDTWVIMEALQGELERAHGAERLVLGRYDKSAIPLVQTTLDHMWRACMNAEPESPYSPGEPHCYYDEHSLGKAIRFCECTHPEYHPVIPDWVWGECERSRGRRTLVTEVIHCSSGEEFAQRVAEATGMD